MPSTLDNHSLLALQIVTAHNLASIYISSLNLSTALGHVPASGHFFIISKGPPLKGFLNNFFSQKQAVLSSRSCPCGSSKTLDVNKCKLTWLGAGKIASFIFTADLVSSPSTCWMQVTQGQALFFLIEWQQRIICYKLNNLTLKGPTC